MHPHSASSAPSAFSKVFAPIKGGKAFAVTQPWFQALLKEIGQPMTKVMQVAH